jgi:hypothetical protein
MSLLENNKDVQRGAAMLEQTNQVTYLTDLYNSNFGTVKAAVAFVFFGFIIAPIQYLVQNAQGTKTYDQLCAKFAKLSIQVEESKGGVGYNALKKQQTEVFTELKGRVQNLTQSFTGKTAKADATAVIQAAQYKLQQAYCAAKGMPTDGTNDQEDVIEAALDYSSQLVVGLSSKSIRASAGEVGATVDGISTRMQDRVKELSERGYHGGKAADVEAELEERIGDQLHQKYSGRRGDAQFARVTADLRPSQVNAAAEKEVSKCIADLKKLAKGRQDAIEAVNKNAKAIEKQREKAEEILATLGQEGSKSERATGLYADMAQLEVDLQEAQDAEEPSEEDISDIEGEIAELSKEIRKLEGQLRSETDKFRELNQAARKLAQAQVKAENKYFEHLEKFFGITVEAAEEESVEPRVTGPHGMDKKVLEALVNAGRVEDEEETDNGSVKVTYGKLPKDADLKKAVDREALKEKVVADRKADVELVARLREEAAERAKPKAKKEELSMEEMIARGIAEGFSRAQGRGRPSEVGMEDELSQVDEREFASRRRPQQRHDEEVSFGHDEFQLGRGQRTHAYSSPFGFGMPSFQPRREERRDDLSATFVPSSMHVDPSAQRRDVRSDVPPSSLHVDPSALRDPTSAMRDALLQDDEEEDGGSK